MTGLTPKAVAEVDGRMELFGRFFVMLAATNLVISGGRVEYAVTRAFEVYDRVVEEEHRREEKMRKEADERRP